MRDVIKAREALKKAAQAATDIERTVWLAKAADHAVADRAVLVGGAAVNIFTGLYRPTDVDLCAYLDDGDRRTLAEIGFTHSHGDHFAYQMPDGERWLLEFPDTRVDGTVMQVRLATDEELTVISLESLVVDRIDQATDRTETTFEEAVRLCVAVLDTADWSEVERQMSQRHEIEPYTGIIATYERVMERVRLIVA